MRVLIIYETIEGQTRKIAEFLRAEFIALNYDVHLCDVTADPLIPAGFDAVLISAPLHMEEYPSALMYYIRQHHKALNKTLSVFLSVSLAAAYDDTETQDELKAITTQSLKPTGWEPHLKAYIAGALSYTKYDYLKKYIGKLIENKGGKHRPNSSDVEYTDWDELKALAKRIDEMLVSAGSSGKKKASS